MLCLSVSVFFLKKGVPYLGVGAWEFFASFFMMVGYLYRKSLNAIVNTYTKWILLICLLLLLLGNEFWQSGMTDPQWYNVIPYSLSALSGSILTVILSRFFVNHYRHSVAYSFFVYMGNHTLVILTWHFLCFKIVNLLIIKLNFLQIEHLAEFPVIQPYASAGWWVAYVLVGVLIPLVCTYGSTKIKCQINE